MKKKTVWITAIVLSGLLLYHFLRDQHNSTNESPKAKLAVLDAASHALFDAHCSNCHLLPDPRHLTKTVWQKSVLPIMAIRMGLRDGAYERQVTEEEKKIEEKNGIIPNHPLISRETFNNIADYIVRQAPDSLPVDMKRLHRTKALNQFVRRDVPLFGEPPSLITALCFEEKRKRLWVGDLHGKIYQWNLSRGIVGEKTAASPPVHFNFFNHQIFRTEIGELMPSELSSGALVVASRAGEKVLAARLHRPVYTAIEDINGDGLVELVVCNFGKNVGSLSLYKKKHKSEPYTEQVLLPLPGATKCYIKDMNGDGKKDIVALLSQGDESMYVFENMDNLQFKPYRILRFPPDYGTSDFILVDYNRDGFQDVITVNGDNADYSVVLKGYHGVRIFLNQHNYRFHQVLFFPVYGATRLVADDFDGDNDVDVAINSFYPDYGPMVKESFLYLECKDEKTYHYEPYALVTGLPVRSLTLEKGDVDGDGDTDLLLGHFALSPVPAPATLERAWLNATYGLIVMVNQIHR